MHPKKELFETTMMVRGMRKGVSYWYFRRHVLPVAKRYASILAEIEWNDRLQVHVI